MTLTKISSAQISRIKALGTLPDRILKDADQDIISIKDCGVLGDGSDETVAIQAAFTYCLNSGQRELYIPAGTYGIKAPINMSGVSVRGQSGIGSVFSALPGFVGTHMLFLNADTAVSPGGASDSFYNNFRLLGNRTTVGSAVGGIEIIGDCIGNSFEHVRFNEMAGTCIKMTGGFPVGNSLPTLTSFKHTRMVDCDGIGYHLEGAENITIIHPVINLVGDHAILIDPTTWTGPFTVAVSEVDILAGYFEWTSQIYHNHPQVYIKQAYNVRLTKCRQLTWEPNAGIANFATKFEDCRFCVQDGNTISGFVNAGSKKVNVQGGTRQQLLRLQSDVTPAEIAVTAAYDCYIERAYAPGLNTQYPIFASNDTAWVSGTTVFMQPNTGHISATEALCQFPTPTRMTIGAVAAHCATLPGGANIYTVTLRKNGVDAQSVSLSNTNAALAVVSTADLVFNELDLISIKITGNGIDIPLRNLKVTLGVLS